MTIDNILKLFEGTLEFPVGESPRIFLCPIGQVGAGKTTVIKPLAKELNLLRVSTDEFRKLSRENGVTLEKATNEYMIPLMKEYAEQGFGIAVDADCADLEKRRRIEEIVAKTEFKVFYVNINPPEEFILNKLRNFKHTWLFRDGDHAVANYYARKSLHENLDIDFTYTFDTSREDLDNQIHEAARIIKQKINA